MVACGWGNLHFPKGTEVAEAELVRKTSPEVLAVWRRKRAVEDVAPPPEE